MPSGAPADTWYKKAKAEYEFDLIIPPNYEVANGVGAATAGIQETVQAIVRPGEEGHGFLVHADKERFSLMDRQGKHSKRRIRLHWNMQNRRSWIRI